VRREATVIRKPSPWSSVAANAGNTTLEVHPVQIPGVPGQWYLIFFEVPAQGLREFPEGVRESLKNVVVTRGIIILKTEKIDLVETVRRAVEASRAEIEACQHEVTLAFPTGVLLIDADAMRIEQVVPTFWVMLSSTPERAAKFGSQSNANLTRRF
jgi:hypothetical protein